jgi:hypothetical protein
VAWVPAATAKGLLFPEFEAAAKAVRELQRKQRMAALGGTLQVRKRASLRGTMQVRKRASLRGTMQVRKRASLRALSPVGDFDCSLGGATLGGRVEGRCSERGTCLRQST